MIFQSVCSSVTFFANPQARKAQFMSVCVSFAQHHGSFLAF